MVLETERLILRPWEEKDAESHIKPFAVGRRNWQFCITVDGATASAMLYSIVETAVACDANAMSRPALFQNPLHQETPPRTLRKKDMQEKHGAKIRYIQPD